MTAARADDPGRIHRVATQLVAAVNAGDIDGILACWDPAGVLLPPHHPAVHGHAAIGAYFARVFAARRFTFAFGDATLTVAADLAVERLAYTVDVLPVGGGPAFSDAGKGLHVYARQPDGTWRIVQDIWNSDRPLAPLPQPASRNAS
jgi:ketosteroid isomerase-like protein